jgi:hypothetical protein
MPVVPDKKAEIVQFFETHLPVWTAQPTKIGLSSAQLTAFTPIVNAARASFNAAEAARSASKGATTNFNTALSTLKNNGAELIEAIKLYARTTGNEEVYSIAQIPPPAARTPTPPPSQPTEIEAIIEPAGALTLRFKATSAGAGATYLVKRKLSTETNFRIVGAAETTRTRYKSFTDTTLPTNANNIQYIIQGQRGGSAGPDSSVFVVTLGGGGLGAVAGGAASVVKLAA